MTAPVPGGTATARSLRVALRRGRRRHRPGSTGEFLTDAYLLVLLAVMYGWAGAATVARYVAPDPGTGEDVVARRWLTVAVLVALAGAAWRGLATLGPLFTTPAAQTWALATPIGRRGWLAPRLAALLGLTALAGAVTGVAAVAFARAGALGWAAAVGALVAVAMAATAVAAQARGARAWIRPAGAVAVVAGIAGGAAVVGARAAGFALPSPSGPRAVVAGLGAVAVVAAVAGVALAVRALPMVDRAALTDGAQVATAMAGVATMLDPMLLVDVLTVRRWRRVGRVRSRRFLRGPWRWLGGPDPASRGSGPAGRPPGAARWWLLLQAELRRTARRPGTLVAAVVLLLVPYAVDVVAASFVAPARIIAGYLAVDRLSGGLRTVCRSAPLRRSLGGDDTQLRAVHLVLPAVGLSLWWALTAPVLGRPPSTLDLLLAVGVLAAVYRAAGRKPVSYTGTAVDTPFGLIPADLLRQVFRGPDVLAVLVLVGVLAQRR